MYRIASFNRASAKPARPADVETPGWFQDQTIVDYGFLNGLMDEVANGVTQSGITLDRADDGQLYDAIARNGGVTFSRMVSWLGFQEVNTAPTGMTVDRNVTAGGADFTRTAASTNNGDGDLLVIPVERTSLDGLGAALSNVGKEIVGAKLHWDLDVAWDGVHVTRSIELIHVTANGTVTAIGSADLDLTTTPNAPTTLTMGATPTIATGDSLFALFKLSRTGTTTGRLVLFAMEVIFEEGNAD